MIILNIILFLIFLFIIFYTIYTLTINVKAFGVNNYLANIRQLAQTNEAINKLCVIVWASEHDKGLYPLLKILDNQKYDSKNYEVHVIYKKEEQGATLPESAYGAFIHPIENPEYFSKDKAVSLFVDKMVQEGNFDAFVFLGADRIIDDNYLSNINKSIYPSCVLSGRMTVIPSHKDFFSSLKCQILRAYLKYENNVQLVTRAIFDMPVIIDGSNCVISSDILEKTGRVCFETKNDELKFSLFLASNAIKPMFAPFVATAVELENFDASTPTLLQKLAMFKYYLPISILKPWYFKEFVFHVFKPDAMGVAFLYLILLVCAFKYFTALELKFALHLGLLLVVNFVIGAFAAKLSIKEKIYVMMYPVLIGWQRAKLFTKRISLMWIENRIHEDENVSSATINTIVFDGKKDHPCKLVLVSEDGMRKVVFECGKRHITSDSFIRMYDAMGDITQKLKSKGFTLKVCQNCGNYCAVPDGTVDLLKGECQINSIEENINRQTLIWNTCSNFMNLEIKEIIDGFNFQKDD